MNPVVRELLPPMPWSHSREEAKEVYECISQLEMHAPNVSCKVRLIKLFFTINNKMDL